VFAKNVVEGVIWFRWPDCFKILALVYDNLVLVYLNRTSKAIFQCAALYYLNFLLLGIEKKGLPIFQSTYKM